jgi:hypothetical protein
MDCTCGDQKLGSDRRMTKLSTDLELHLAFQHDDRFVDGMREVHPSLTWPIDPEVATEPRFSQSAGTGSRSILVMSGSLSTVWG